MFVVMRKHVETQDYSEASQLTNRIDRQAAVVDTTNVIYTLNTSAYHNSVLKGTSCYRVITVIRTAP